MIMSISIINKLYYILLCCIISYRIIVFYTFLILSWREEVQVMHGTEKVARATFLRGSIREGNELKYNVLITFA